MTDPIAERRYTNADGQAVVARWYRPEPDQNDWRCAWSIQIGESEPKTRQTLGVDSVQALELALKDVATELYMADPAVHWFAPGDELGLPVADVLSDLRDARRASRVEPPRQRS